MKPLLYLLTLIALSMPSKVLAESEKFFSPYTEKELVEKLNIAETFTSNHKKLENYRDVLRNSQDPLLLSRAARKLYNLKQVFSPNSIENELINRELYIISQNKTLNNTILEMILERSTYLQNKDHQLYSTQYVLKNAQDPLLIKKSVKQLCELRNQYNPNSEEARLIINAIDKAIQEPIRQTLVLEAIFEHAEKLNNKEERFFYYEYILKNTYEPKLIPTAISNFYQQKNFFKLDSIETDLINTIVEETAKKTGLCNPVSQGVLEATEQLRDDCDCFYGYRYVLKNAQDPLLIKKATKGLYLLKNSLLADYWKDLIDDEIHATTERPEIYNPVSEGLLETVAKVSYAPSFYAYDYVLLYAQDPMLIEKAVKGLRRLQKNNPNGSLSPLIDSALKSIHTRKDLSAKLLQAIP